MGTVRSCLSKSTTPISRMCAVAKENAWANILFPNSSFSEFKRPSMIDRVIGSMAALPSLTSLPPIPSLFPRFLPVLADCRQHVVLIRIDREFRPGRHDYRSLSILHYGRTHDCVPVS